MLVAWCAVANAIVKYSPGHYPSRGFREIHKQMDCHHAGGRQLTIRQVMDNFPAIRMTPPAHVFSAVVVAPTYNNASTLAAVVSRLPLPVIVVNDGSTDATAEVLRDLQTGGSIRVIDHPVNLGKAAALQSGFNAALAAGYTHAVTIDTDGQLDPAELPRLLRAAEAAPEALIVGVRDEEVAGYPARSRLGRKISNLFIRLESGLRVADSQCGYRVYPLRLIQFIQCRAGHYGFETEILTRAAWAGCDVIGVPVSCRYFEAAERISHFRPGLDSLRAAAMHARLVLRALLPVPHARCSVNALPAPQRGWKRLADWLNPARAWRDLREHRVEPQEMATGVAVGVFIANTPMYGLHTALSLYAARRLHLNPLSVIAGSHLSTPPVGPILVAAAIGVGHWLLHGQWLTIPRWQDSWQGWIQLFGELMLEWSLGAMLVGSALAVVAYLLSHLLIRYMVAARGGEPGI